MAHRLPLVLSSFASGAAAIVHGLVWYRTFASPEAASFDPGVVSTLALVAGVLLGIACASRGETAGERAQRRRPWIDVANAIWLLATAASLSALEAAVPPGTAIALAAGMLVTGGLVGARHTGRAPDAAFWLGVAAGSAYFVSAVLPLLGPAFGLIAPALLGIVAALVLRAGPAGEAGSASVPGDPDTEEPALGPRFLAVALGVSGFAAVGWALSIRAPLGLLEAGGHVARVGAVACGALGVALGIAATSLARHAAASFRSRVRQVLCIQLVLGLWLVATVAGLPDLGAWQARAGALGAWLPAAALVGLPAFLAAAGLASLTRLGRLGGPGDAKPLVSACVGAGMAGALFASLPLELGATLFAVVLLEFAIAVWVLLGSQIAGSPGAAALRPSGAEWLGAVLLPLLVSLGYGGISIERTLAPAAGTLPGELGHVVDGGAVHSISERGDARVLRLQGEPITSVSLSPPFVPAPDFWLVAAPFLSCERPESALLLDLDGGVPLAALLETSLPRVDVVGDAASRELVTRLHEGHDDPLENQRVDRRGGSAAAALLDAARSGGHDLVSSAPRDLRRRRDAARLSPGFFERARTGLREGGVFASLLPLAALDVAAAHAVLAGFERAFPGSLLLDASLAGDGSAWILLGSTGPLRLDLDEIAKRMHEPLLARALRRYGVERVEDLVARVEGPVSAFTPEDVDIEDADPIPLAGALEAMRPPEAATTPRDLLVGRSAAPPLLPETQGALDGPALVDALLERGRAPQLAQWINDPRPSLDPLGRAVATARLELLDPRREAAALAALEALGREHPDEAAPLRVHALHLAMRRGAFAEAGALFEAAHERSGAADDAYDAARAFDRVDEARAWAWIERIPEAERGDYPRIAWFEAKAALREGRQGAELVPLLVSLSQFRRSVEGRRLPGVAEVLVALARAAGRPDLAAIHAEAHRAEQQRAAAPVIARARAALDDARLSDVMQALSELAGIWPGSPELLELRARLAAAVGDDRAAGQALRVVRAQASGPDQAIARENALRRELGLPLLPRLEADEILAAGNRRP